MGRVWFYSHSIEMRYSLDSWSVFLQDGVTFFGSDSTDMISIEGITAVGLLGAFFRPLLGVNFGHPGVVRSALKSGGSSTFSCLHFWCGLCVSLLPTKEWVLALLLLLALLPLALPSRVGLLRRSSGDSFHQGVFHARVFPPMMAR